MEIFDFHCHCFPPALARRAVESVKIRVPGGPDGTLEGNLEYLKARGVTGCALLHMASRPDTQDKVNAFALSTRGPGRFVFGSVHPEAPDAVGKVQWLWDQGIRGIKFHTAHQNFPFDDPKYLPLYRRIGALNMVTLVHCGPSLKSDRYPVYPRNVARVIDAFLGAPFICAHMGGVGPEDGEFPLLCRLPVLVDTAMVYRWMDAAAFTRAAEALGSHRILFGTDLPWGSWEKTLNLITAATQQAPTLDEEAILSKNAQSLIRAAGGGYR